MGDMWTEATNSHIWLKNKSIYEQGYTVVKLKREYLDIEKGNPDIFIRKNILTPTHKMWIGVYNG